ncbi:hypothetical protein [Burkholderia sp. MS455]|uniref:hypothetical protein n=1 Tax=Burkholderia sp. MS455 TaxID=2811788 RepID=UPI0031BAFD47
MLFGSLGFHDFYAGFNVKGAVKLGLFIVAFLLDATTGFYSKFFLILQRLTGYGPWVACA